MSINIYTVENHLIISGDGTNLIKNELKNTYNAIWQRAPFNFWLIPNTTLKNIENDKNITSKVSINEGKEEKVKKKEISKKISKKDANNVEFTNVSCPLFHGPYFYWHCYFLNKIKVVRY